MVEDSSMTSTALRIPFTDSPTWLSHIEIEKDGKIVHIQVIRGNGHVHSEAAVDAETFFCLIEKIRE